MPGRLGHVEVHLIADARRDGDGVLAHDDSPVTDDAGDQHLMAQLFDQLYQHGQWTSWADV